jgi:hypothetical protein
VVRFGAAAEQAGSNGTARRLRKNVDNRRDADLMTEVAIMTTVKCDQCGERFAISHPSASQDQVLAGRQAIWLADKFVWDHIQETGHRGLIHLPASHEIK